MRGLLPSLSGAGILLLCVVCLADDTGHATPARSRYIHSSHLAEQLSGVKQAETLTTPASLPKPQSVAIASSKDVSHTYGDPPFAIHATSNSPGNITYSLVSGNALVTPEGVVTLTGAGPVTIEAFQAATPDYISATATTSFVVARGTPSIVFTVGSQTTNIPFYVSASSNSTGAFTYSVVSGPATISGNLVTPTGSGTVTIRAAEAADANYNAASKEASVTITAMGSTDTKDFLFASSGSNAQSVVAGNTASYDFNVSPATGMIFTAPISFAVTGLPGTATAQFAPAMIAAGSSSSKVNLLVQTAAQSARQYGSPDKPSNSGELGAMIALATATISRKLRIKGNQRVQMLSLLVLSLCGTVWLAGCGANVVVQVPQSYNFVVVASSGAFQHSQNLTLTVQ